MIKLGYLQDKIFEINNKYPNINYGGCGTFSYHLYQVLKNKYDIIAEIVYIPSETPPGLRPDYDVKFSHILVKINDVLIDNNGLYSKDKYPQLFQNVEFLSPMKLEEMIKIPELWNDRFDSMVYNRNCYVEKVSDKLIKDIYLI